MIVWCPSCETTPLEDPAPWEPYCAGCVYSIPQLGRFVKIAEADICPDYRDSWSFINEINARRMAAIDRQFWRDLEEVCYGVERNPCIVLGDS